MPRVHTRKANKDYPEDGIKKGETYYTWSFRYGGPRKSKTYPKASQLTQSDFLCACYGAQEELDSFMGDSEISKDDLAQAFEDAASTIREQGQECEDKLSNMPDSLQNGPTGELLQNRANACDTLADELESAADDIRNLDGGEKNETVVNAVPNKVDPNANLDEAEEEPWREEAQQIYDGIGWNFEE